MQPVSGYIYSTVDFFIISGGVVDASTIISEFNKYDEEGEPECSRVCRAMQYENELLLMSYY